MCRRQESIISLCRNFREDCRNKGGSGHFFVFLVIIAEEVMVLEEEVAVGGGERQRFASSGLQVVWFMICKKVPFVENKHLLNWRK
jgi:hypothetical protein